MKKLIDIRNKPLYYLSMLVILAAMILLGYAYYLQFWPIRVVTLNKDPMLITEGRVVTEGDHVCLVLDFTKHKSYKAEIQWFMLNGETIPLRSTSLYRRQGHTKTDTCFKIPHGTRPSEYVIQVDIVYQITPFRKITYAWQSEPFTVIEGGEE